MFLGRLVLVGKSDSRDSEVALSPKYFNCRVSEVALGVECFECRFCCVSKGVLSGVVGYLV